MCKPVTISLHVCMYISGFRARQHLRSLAPVMNDGEEKPRKYLTPETCPDRGSNLGPLRDKRACYHLLQTGGQISLCV